MFVSVEGKYRYFSNFPRYITTLKVFELLNKYGPCRVCDWKMFFDPTFHLKGAFSDFGVHVLHRQKSLKKL
jgi:hypothetical protein